MIDPSISELMKKVDSKYTLCTVIGKRARQLVDGAHLLTECSSGCNSEKPVSIAIDEFYQGKFTYVRSK